jgi:hypothetical protein
VVVIKVHVSLLSCWHFCHYFNLIIVLNECAANDGGGESNQPEALQRLIEMELRSNSKQIHPFATPGHGPGIYGHELDMSFGYR